MNITITRIYEAKSYTFIDYECCYQATTRAAKFVAFTDDLQNYYDLETGNPVDIAAEVTKYCNIAIQKYNAAKAREAYEALNDKPL